MWSGDPLSQWPPVEPTADRFEPTSRGRAIRGGAVTVTGNIVSKIAAIGSAIVVARALSTTQFGQFSFAIAYGAFFAMFADLGLDSIATRELAKGDPRDDGRIIGSLLAIKTGVIGVALLVAGCGVLFYAPSLRMGGIFAVLALLNAIPGSLGLLLIARLRMLPLAVIQVGGAGLTVSCYVAVALAGAGPVAFVVAEAATTVITGAAIGAFASRDLRGLAVDRAVVRRLLRRTAPLSVSAIAVLVYRRSDMLLLPVLGTVRELGQYAAAVRIVDSLNVIPQAVAVVALPVLSRRTTENLEVGTAGAGFRLLASAVLPAAAVGTVVGGPLMERIFGAPYAGAGGALAVMLWAHCFGFAGVLLAQLLVARGQERALAELLVAAAIGNIAINLWAIPRFGEMGAAWASFGAYALPFVVGSVVGTARSAVRAALIASLRPAIGSAVLTALLIGLRPGLVGALAVTAVVWPLLLLATGSTSWGELKSIARSARDERLNDPDRRTAP